MNHLEQLLMKLMEAQKMRGTNAMFEIVDTLDKHLVPACSEHDALMADLEFYQSSGKVEEAA